MRRLHRDIEKSRPVVSCTTVMGGSQLLWATLSMASRDRRSVHPCCSGSTLAPPETVTGSESRVGSGLTLKAGSRERIIEDALAVEGAGAFAVVLEGMPAELAAEITERLSVPTIGIGAGLGCDGQILVTHDMLGMNPDFRPKFVKAYADLSDTISQAVKSYMHEVRQDLFPAPQHTFSGSAPRGDAPKRTRLKVV